MLVNHTCHFSWVGLGHFSHVRELFFVIISIHRNVQRLLVSLGISLFAIMLCCHSGPQHILLRSCMFGLFPLDFLLMHLSGPHFVNFLLKRELLFLLFLLFLFIIRVHRIGVELDHFFIILQTHWLVKLGLLGTKVLILFTSTDLFIVLLWDP